MSALRSWLVKGILGLFSDTIFILSSFILLTYLSPKLTLLTIIVLLFAVALSVAFGLYIRKTVNHRNNRRLELLKTAETGLRNLSAIKVLNRERIEADQFAARNEKFLTASLSLHLKNSVVEAWVPATFFGLIGLIMWQVSSDSGLAAEVSGGKLITFILLLFYVQGSVRRIMRIPTIWQKGLASFSGLLSEMNAETENKTGEEVGRNSKGLIQIRNLTFRYPEQAPLFEGLSLSINGTGLTWISGKAGSGKSTLLKLLTFLFEPESGEITLDGIGYMHLTPFGVRKKIAVVSNGFPLLGKTILEAVTYNSKGVKKEQIMRSLIEHGIIGTSEKTEFLATKLESVTSRLTIRKLELARALLTRKDIILLDEPFAGLTSAETGEFGGLLNRLASHKTIVIFTGVLPDVIHAHKKIELP